MMASGFPGAIDNFTDPLANSLLTSPSHAGLHSDVNDAVEKIETYMGLVKVIPTGVTSAGGTAATLASDGTITIGTSNTSVTITNAFSSLYNNYRVIVNGGAASAYGDIHFQFSGVTTGYFGAAFGATLAGAFSGAGDNNASQWSKIGWADGNSLLAVFDVLNPFLSKRKYIASGTASIAGAYLAYQGECTNTSSQTSMILKPSTGNWTGGTIRVYGYRN